MEETLKKLHALIESLAGVEDNDERSKLVAAIEDTEELAELRKAAATQLAEATTLAEAEAFKGVMDLAGSIVDAREAEAKAEADKLAELKATVPQDEAEETEESDEEIEESDDADDE